MTDTTSGSLKRGTRWKTTLLGCVVLFCFACVMAMCVGSTRIPLSRMLTIIHDGEGTVEHTVIFGLRLPRVILGVAVGGALSLAGVLLQGTFRNPLVAPYTLGISGGAALGVCLNVLFGLEDMFGVWSIAIAGFAGALGTVFLVYAHLMRRRATGMRDILLIGVMISFVCSSLVMLIMAISKAEDLHGIIFWLMGSLEEPNQLLIGLTALVSLGALGISFFFCMDLNALALGEEEAVHLGINVARTQRILFILASVITGVSVSAAGVIGFVGLVVPHFLRLLVGNDHRALLPASWLCGATFLVLCDTVARTVIRPSELPVGVITGIVGGSLFVYALSRRSATSRR